MVDIASIATAVITTIAPYLSTLLQTGAHASKTLKEVFSKDNVDTLERVQNVWDTLKGVFVQDEKVERAAKTLSEEGDEPARDLFATRLVNALNANPALVESLKAALGGDQRITNLISVDHDAEILRNKLIGHVNTIQAKDRAKIEGNVLGPSSEP